MKMKELAGTGMVEVYNNQQLWSNRQTQKIYDAFVDVLFVIIKLISICFL